MRKQGDENERRFHRRQDRRLIIVQKRAEYAYLLKMFATYMTVGIILLALIGPLCLVFLNDQEEKQNRLYADALQSMVDDLEENLLYLRDIFLSDGKNDYMNRVSVMRGQITPSHVYAIKRAQEYIATLVSSNSYLADAIVQFRHNDVILTGKSVYYSPAEFKQFYGLYLGDQGVEFSIDESPAGMPSIRYYTIDRLESYDQSADIAFCYSIPINASVAYGNIHFLIRMEKLLSYMPEIFVQNGKVTLSDRQGELIMRKEFSQFLAGQGKTAAFECASKSGALRLLATVPDSVLLDILKPFRVFILCYLMGLLLVSLLLALIAALRQYKPVREICRQMQKDGLFSMGEFTMEQLSAYIKQMQSKHADVMQTLSGYAENLRIAQLGDLLRGSSSIDKCSMIRLPERYYVGYSVVKEDGQSTLEHLFAINCYDDSLAQYQRIVFSEDTMAFIIPAQAKAMEDVCGRADELFQQVGCRIYLYFSDEQHEAQAVHSAFEQARIRSIEGEQQAQRISMSMQMQLLQQVMAGNAESACEQINMLIRGLNHDVNELAERYSICSFTLHMAAQQLGNAVSIPPYDIARAPGELVGQLEQAARLLCEEQARNQAKGENQLRQQIVSYLEDNYHRYDLSLHDVREAFGISERAALAQITAITGLGFSAYVQKLRLERAAQLLSTGNMPIQAVYEVCGYNTLSAFHKAFKKHYGITPGEFRKSAVQSSGH